MTDEEMTATVSLLLDDPRLDKFIPYYLEQAKGAVMAHLYPYKDAQWEDVPSKHHARTCEIAVFLVNKRGAEGETAHSENGVSRSYESAGIPKSYFEGMVPFCGVPCSQVSESTETPIESTPEEPLPEEPEESITPDEPEVTQ